MTNTVNRLPIFDETYNSLMESLIIQIMWKSLIIEWCNKKSLRNSDVIINKVNIRKILDKIYCCLRLGDDEEISYEKMTDDNLYRILNISEDNILNIKNDIQNILKDPNTVPESEVKKKIQEIIVFTKSIEGKISTTETILLLGEKHTMKLINLEPDFLKF